MKEFSSPYHALAAQTEALVQLIDALQNAHRHGLYFRIEYQRQSPRPDAPVKVMVIASTHDICDYDDELIPIPEMIEWDISYLFKSDMVAKSNMMLMFLTDITA